MSKHKTIEQIIEEQLDIITYSTPDWSAELEKTIVASLKMVYEAGIKEGRYQEGCADFDASLNK